MQYRQAHKHPASSTAQTKTTEPDNEVMIRILPPIKDVVDLEKAMEKLGPDLLRKAQRYIRSDRETAEAPADIVQHAMLRATEFIQNKKHVISSKRLGLSEQQIEQAKKTGKITPTAEQAEIANPEGWLSVITHNIGCNYCISRRRLLELQKKAKKQVEENEPFDDPEYKAIQEENNRELHKLVDQLPQKLARVINLSFFEGYSLKEIATDLNCCINTVKSYKKRALTMLGEAMTRQREIKDGKIGRKKRKPVPLIQLPVIARLY